MISDLDYLVKNAEFQDRFHQIDRKELPNSLDRLGHATEFSCGSILKGENGEVLTEVAYGTKNLYWGLRVGPEGCFYTGPGSGHKKFYPVATNACFFTDDGW